jgi:glycerophosphoryl diester phosphodiesterase
MTEVFDFASCVDPAHRVKWNIESKINPVQYNQTKGVKDFVTLQHAAFKKSPYYKSITYQSFDWRTLIAMKKLAPEVLTSALIDDTTYFATNGTPSAWLGGVNIDKFGSKKDSIDLKIPRAAASIGAGVLSPYVGNGGGTTELVPFVTKAMVKESHRLGLFVKPWTVNNLTVLADHVSWGIDGTITDCKLFSHFHTKAGH